MPLSKLIELSYFDGGSKIRLTAYADTVILENGGDDSTITAIRFGGYPEMVRAMSDAIYGGGTVEAVRNDVKRTLKSRPKGYRRQLAHDGVYATATLMANDDKITAEPENDDGDDDGGQGQQQELQPRKCYIFCPAGDRDRLFEEVDRKTAAPLIPEFRDYVLDGLTARGDLRQLEVVSLREKLDAFALKLTPEDANVVELLEDGLKSGAIAIPGAAPGQPDGFDGVENITGYLNTFGPTVAQRIRSQFQPLFDPAAEPLSEEVLAVNDTIMAQAGYSLYDAQLAVAEATKRQLAAKKSPSLWPSAEVGRRRSARRPWGPSRGCTPPRRAGERPSTSSWPPPTSQKSGCGRSARPCPTPSSWWSRASPTWTGCTPHIRPGTRACTPCSARRRPGTAICATPPSPTTAGRTPSAARTAGKR